MPETSSRNGPIVIEYRDTSWNGWPVRATLSCLGCIHLQVGTYGDSRCAHPRMIERYEVPQSICGHWDWKLPVVAWQCPEAFPIDQPAECRIDRPPRHWPTHGDLQIVSYAVTWTSGWGERVLADDIAAIRRGETPEVEEAGHA